MKKVNEYEYCEPNKDGCQYDLSTGSWQKAKYIHALDEVDSGNMLIEALPAMTEYQSDEESFEAFSRKPLIGRIKGPECRKIERIIQTSHLPELRLPLPFHENLANRIAYALTVSYRNRLPYMDVRNSEICIGGTAAINPFGAKEMEDGDPGDCSLCLIGPSGCGKTSTKKMLLERYPQVIVHETSKGLFHQVVYLCAECPVNSNISELLDSFGRALDSALGNMDPFYEKRIAKLSSIGDKTALLCSFIRTFSIGMLVIDEIQHMDFKANNTRSFDIFLKIINSTKVGIFVLGQGDAYIKIAKNLQVKRRLGTQYYGVEYCFDYDYFKLLVSELSMYSWRDDGKKLIDIYPGNETAETISAGTEMDTSDARIFSTDKHRYGRPLSENEIKALYFVSTGSISVLITCWIAIQRYGIEFGEWPELTYDFLHVLLERQNHGLEEQNRVEIKKDPMIAELGVITEGRKMLEKLFEEEKKSSALKAISEACVASSANDENNAMPSISESVFQDVSTHNAQRNNPWTIDQIQDVVVKITKKNNDASKEELVMACIQKLEKTRKPRRTIKKQLLTAADPTGNERFINLAQQTLDEASKELSPIA